jgi:aldose 1-epimerase
MAGKVVTLSAGNLALELLPALGGTIGAFRLKRGGAVVDLMRPAGPDETDVRKTCCFPLVPYSNRIVGGVFQWNGKTHHLRRGLGDARHALHGEGFVNPWRVALAETDAARLVFAHEPAPERWPFRFTAEQHFRLSPDRLVVELALVNEADEPAPAGFGLHPYFPDPAAAALEARMKDVWIADEAMVPLRREPIPAAWDFAAGRPMGDVRVDNCFGGWEGAARIRWPARGVGLDISAAPIFGHLVVFRPPDRDFFCVEPVSHANNAINLGPTQFGLRILAPGERLAGKIEFRVVSA